MDFSKLNLEFANMQKTVEDYNKMITLINARIKDNLRTVSKYETKMKNTKNKLEKGLAHLYITSIKCETEFLESLVKEEKTNVSAVRIRQRPLPNSKIGVSLSGETLS